MRKILREPMVVFAIVGLALYAAAARIDVPPERVIRIDASEVAQLSAFWRSQAQRPPTPQELAAAIDERVDEEVLYREAVRLGLDRDDVIVRRRLAQKLAFLNDDTATVPTPTEAQLRAYFEAHRGDYAEPDLFTLQHVYFSPDRRGARIAADARALLATLNRTASHDDPAAVIARGDPFMLPTVYADVPVAELDRDYGASFARAVRGLPVGRWAGPVASSLGLHLVRVVARRVAYAPDFATVRERVRQDVVTAGRREANRRWVAGLRARYRVEVEGVRMPGRAPGS